MAAGRFIAVVSKLILLATVACGVCFHVASAQVSSVKPGILISSVGDPLTLKVTPRSSGITADMPVTWTLLCNGGLDGEISKRSTVGEVFEPDLGELTKGEWTVIADVNGQRLNAIVTLDRTKAVLFVGRQNPQLPANDNGLAARESTASPSSNVPPVPDQEGRSGTKATDFEAAFLKLVQEGNLRADVKYVDRLIKFRSGVDGAVAADPNQTLKDAAPKIFKPVLDSIPARAGPTRAAWTKVQDQLLQQFGDDPIGRLDLGKAITSEQAGDAAEVERAVQNILKQISATGAMTGGFGNSGGNGSCCHRCRFSKIRAYCKSNTCCP